jgi:hypothetical protein
MCGGNQNYDITATNLTTKGCITVLEINVLYIQSHAKSIRSL